MMNQAKHNPKHARRRPAAGFSLLEVILAMTVTATVSAALFTSMSAAFKARQNAEDHLAGREAARAVLAIIQADLQCVPPAGGRIGGVFIGEDESITGGRAADELTFITANPALKTEQDFADLRQVELRLLESNSDPDHRVLARVVTGNLLATTTPEPTIQVLARRVVAMDLQYYDGGDWLDEWDSVDRDNLLPLAVQITLTVAPELSREPEDEDEREKTYLTTTQIVRIPTATEAEDEADIGNTGLLPGLIP